MDLFKKVAAEFLGTFWLVLGGCGSAVISAGFPKLGIGFGGVAVAFGLTVLTAAFALGATSGAHFNPAVSVGLFAAGRFSRRLLLPYIVAQVIGAVVASSILYLIASGHPGWEMGNFAANGYGEHSPGGYNLASSMLTEIVFTFMFLAVILGATSTKAQTAFAPVAIGLALTLIHLVTIPITNASVNPARSTGPALFVGGWALAQLWVFWVAPLIGASLAGLAYRLTSSTVVSPEALRAPRERRTFTSVSPQT